MDKPLLGKKILVTRGKQQAKLFSDKIEAEGALPFVVPLLKFKMRESQENHAIFSKLHEFSWIFFTSANGVKFFFEQCKFHHVTLEDLKSKRFAVIGKKTEHKLHTYGLRADFLPDTFNGRTMVDQFLNDHSEPGSILLTVGNISRNEIASELERQQVLFQKAVVYDTLWNGDEKEELLAYMEKAEIDAYTFTSPSSLKSFCRIARDRPELFRTVKEQALCVCIGPTTGEAACRAGFHHVLVPDEYTVEGMINKMRSYYKRKG
ncbi:uroporphyrinogen-III synthase [Sediminibacillus massiliensis]|uniref:uroporphyrinogen-III synthase n=1 Tax=Sediminibacillus massiliensis TaxID=1926277 RepID=UPI0009888EF8|nr:uroporphyrinogen-III synthase [Sediminibacillus massiliensis]